MEDLKKIKLSGVKIQVDEIFCQDDSDNEFTFIDLEIKLPTMIASKWSNHKTNQGNVVVLPPDYIDFSLHFTLKDQKLEDIKEKFNNWLDNTTVLNLDDFPDQTTLRHCFMDADTIKKKKLSTDLIDFLDELGVDQKRYYNMSKDIAQNRELMFDDLHQVGGVAIFVGKLTEGVLEEFNIAHRIGIHCILIP